jgi:hypothetical protein
VFYSGVDALKKITIILPYYDNPEMFKIHQEGWLNWGENLKAHTEIIVIDDCSPNHPAVKHVNLKLLNNRITFRLYQTLQDVPWNWIACRNIGAHHAAGDWLLLTDMDHIVTPRLLNHLHKMPVDDDYIMGCRNFYVPSRVDGPEQKENPKPHPNSYFMHKTFFWKVGGYDESYSGLYGTDGIWRRRCEAKGKRVMLDVPLIQYLPKHVPDCRSNLPRKSPEQRAAVEAITEGKINEIISGLDVPIKTLSFPYERVL